MGSSRVLSLIRDDGHEQRDCRRRRVLLSAQLHTSSSAYRVRIRDISAGGARIEGDNLPGPGTVVCLQRGARAAYGTIAWVRGGTGGLQFDEPLDEDHFGSGQPGEGDPPAAVPYRRPGFGRRESASLYSTGEGWIDGTALPPRR